MSYRGPKAFQNAISEIAKLPGIGEKTAQRLVFHLMQRDYKEASDLADAIQNIKKDLRLCSICFGYTDLDPCPICQDSHRDQGIICVIEDPSDLFAIEQSARFRGVYHVLHGKLAPLEGIGPSDLKISELFQRIEQNKPLEVILATNPDMEGDATALYIAKLLKKRNIRTSRIAMGIPMGSHLEYTDQATLGRAIVERREFASS